MNELLSIQQAAKVSGRDASTLHRAIKRGDLRAARYGHFWLVSRTELARWLQDGPHQPGVRRPPKK